MDINEAVGAVIKETRSAQKITQEKLAVKVNVATRTLQRYEVSLNDIRTIYSVAQALGVELSELIKQAEKKVKG